MLLAGVICLCSLLLGSASATGNATVGFARQRSIVARQSSAQTPSSSDDPAQCFGPANPKPRASGSPWPRISFVSNTSQLPDTTWPCQTTTNRCGSVDGPDAQCGTLAFNSIDDFCIFAPPNSSDVADAERVAVAWCLAPGHGARIIPPGTFTALYWHTSPDYLQITARGDFTKINVKAGDQGGELDPHGYDGYGNPIGGRVFSSGFTGLRGIQTEAHDYDEFLSADTLCIRVCKPGPNSIRYCNHLLDEMGCGFNVPGDYDVGTFETCDADNGLPAGFYPLPGQVTTPENYSGWSEWTQGMQPTPSAHPAPSSSNCLTQVTLTPNAAAISAAASSGSHHASRAKTIATVAVNQAQASAASSAPAAVTVTITSSPVIMPAMASAGTSISEARSGAARPLSPHLAVFAIVLVCSIVAIRS